METAPMDGTEILIKTHVGIVNAWFDYKYEERFEWVCYDGMFRLDDDGAVEGWMPLSNFSEFNSVLDRNDLSSK